MDEIDFEPYMSDLYIEAMRWAICKPVDWDLTFKRVGVEAFLRMFAVRHINFGVRSGKTTAAVAFAKRSRQYGIVTYDDALATALRNRYEVNAKSLGQYVAEDPKWDFVIFDDPHHPHNHFRKALPRLHHALCKHQPVRFICLGNATTEGAQHV